MFNIYKDDYFQIKGDYEKINGYNTINPYNWR